MTTMITRSAFRANKNQYVDGFLVKQLFGAGLTWLENNKETVNRLNVFPVPDGDTGTNMFLTMRNAYKEIASLEENHVGNLTKALARGALTGARGNSGVILSQLFAGTAKVLEPHEKLTAPLLALALRSAVEAAYNAVEKPVEGTILTVAREMMESVVKRQEREMDLVALLKRMLFAGRASLRRTPEQLPLLKKAGVVDSGGAGLIYIFEGMLRALCGKDLTANTVEIAAADSDATLIEIEQTETWQDALVPEDELGYGYDVQFLMRGDNLNINEVREKIQAMGWSTLVVGDNSLIKVHVHVHNPGEPLSYAINLGASLDDIVVENMQAQYEQYVVKRADEALDIRTDIQGAAPIVVAAGEGMKKLFMDYGAAYVISGGQTMNPSTGDFLEIIQALPNEEILLLPNNKNVLLAAQQAAKAAEELGRRVKVVPSTTVPQGIIAMLEYSNMTIDDQPSLEDLADAMTHVLPHVLTCEVTNATRDVELDNVNVRAGQYIGLLNDVLVVSADDVTQVTLDLLRKAKAEKYELITLYYGSDSTKAKAEALAQRVRSEFSSQEIKVEYGGQALYPYIISVE